MSSLQDPDDRRAKALERVRRAIAAQAAANRELCDARRDLASLEPGFQAGDAPHAIGARLN